MPPFLKEKIGPFPAYIWGGLIATGIIAGFVMRRFTGDNRPTRDDSAPPPVIATEPVGYVFQPTDEDGTARNERPPVIIAPPLAPPPPSPPMPIGTSISAPVVASVTPKEIRAGDPIVLTGNHLTAITAITINNVAMPITSKTDGKITVNTLPTVTTGFMKIKSAFGEVAISWITVTSSSQKQPATVNDPIPGGYPADCTGIGPKDPSNPGQYDQASIDRWVEAYKRSGHSDHIAWQRALGMALGGSTGKANLYDMRNVYLPNEAKWGTFNQIRRSHGLKALTRSTYQRLVAEIDQELARSGDHKSASKQFVYRLFLVYHAPYRC